MARGHVCGCGSISRTPVCVRCQATRAEKRAAYDARRNAGSFYLTPFWRRLSALVRARDGGSCVACGGPGEVVHHIEPRDSTISTPTGRDREGNLCLLCASCHSTLEADRRAGRDDTDLIRLTRLLAY